MKGILLEAKYIEEAQSVLFLVDGEHGKFRSQVHRDEVATFGDRTEEEINTEMQKYTFLLNKIYRNKEIDVKVEQLA